VRVLDKLFKIYEVKSILDIACGIGRHSVPLSKLGYQVTGIDYSPFQLSEAKKYAKKEKARVKFLKKDANNFKLPIKFDAAICMWSTLGEEPLQYKKVIKNVFDSLEDKGIFIIENKNWKNIPKNKERITKNSYSAGKLKIKQTLHDRYTDHFRIRDAIYRINGKEYKDLCITHIIRPREWVNELKIAGFRKCKIYRNYKKKETSVLIVGQK